MAVKRNRKIKPTLLGCFGGFPCGRLSEGSVFTCTGRYSFRVTKYATYVTLVKVKNTELRKIRLLLHLQYL